MKMRALLRKVKACVAGLFAAVLTFGAGTVWADDIDYLTDTGLRYSADRFAQYPKLIEFEDELYVFWEEMDDDSNKIRAMKYVNGQWEQVLVGSVDYFNISNMNYAFDPTMAVHNNQLFVAWEEQDESLEISSIRVKRLENGSWEPAEGADPGGIKKSPEDYDYASWPLLVTYGDDLYMFWQEYTNCDYSCDVYAAKYNDQTGEWDPLNGVNYLQTQLSNVNEFHAVEYMDNLYVAYTSYENDHYVLRLKAYNKDSKSWTGHILELYKNEPGIEAYEPRMVVHQGDLYIAWEEYYIDDYYGELRVFRIDGDGDDADSDYVDEDTGLNFQEDSGVFDVTLASFGDHLYAAWEEEGFDLVFTYTVRVKKYNGSTWEWVGGSDGAYGLQGFAESHDSYDPYLYAGSTGLYIAFDDPDSDADSSAIFVAQLASSAPSNAAPQALNVRITGIPLVGQTLTGEYNYFDADSDPEGESVFQWYMANEANGTRTAIPGATSEALVITQELLNKYLFFSVKPVAESGTATGTETESAAFGPVELLPGDANGDGIVTTADVLLIYRHLQGKAHLSPDVLEWLDLNGDEVVDEEDAAILINMYLG